MGSAFVSLLSRAAAAVIVFMAGAIFWRRSVKHGCVDDAKVASDHQEEHHPDSRPDPVWTIFLSHSGKQKPFVEHLYEALRGANHTPFYDKHSLRKGSNFPPHIIKAAQGCKLGVVVLSNDFLTSKWPMLELEMLVLQRGSDPMVLPLFYKLSPSDLKSSKHLSKWRQQWMKFAAKNANQWEFAVKALGKINGQVFIQGQSEISYIKKVVGLICNLVPSSISNDVSLVQGHERLAQEVASQFQVAARLQGDKVCMVGLHGITGMGKTTMCKIMCNKYHSDYSGRSYRIEFPSDGDDKKIAQECRKALEKLTNLDERLLNKVDSFDEAVTLMKDYLGQCDVFLAIDNVWESSRETAKRILGVSFSANSKILLTSRSEEVLKDLVRGHGNSCVHPLPSPDWDEAFQIFQETFELADLKSLVNTNLLHRVLERCFFSGKYHPLALKALGQYVKSGCEVGGLGKIEDTLTHFLQGIDNIGDLLLLNYVNLTVEKKHMFLDIVAVVMPVEATTRYFGITCVKAQHWLSILYKHEFNDSKIRSLIYELALDGLIQLENKVIDGRDEKTITVHDLYSDLAQKEAARSPRFITDRSAKSVEEIEWERLERVILREGHRTPRRLIEELQQRECRKLQVLCAENTDFRSGIQLDLMPSLCVLKLERGTLRSIQGWSAAKRLEIVDLHCDPLLES